MDLFSSFIQGQTAGLIILLIYAILFIFCGFGLLFLLIRPIILWYFKVKSIEKKLEENNKIQAQILEQLKILNCYRGDDLNDSWGKTKTSTPKEEPQKDYSAYMPK